MIHIRSQVKTRQSQSYKFLKNFQKSKFWNFARNLTRDTPCLIRCINMKWIQPERTDGRTDRQTDGRMVWNQYTPQQLHCVRGIIINYSFPIVVKIPSKKIIWPRSSSWLQHLYWWLSARLLYLICIGNGDTMLQHSAIGIWYKYHIALLTGPWEMWLWS